MKDYIVKPGDTLGKIAKKRLGAAGRWREIAEINEISAARGSFKSGRNNR